MMTYFIGLIFGVLLYLLTILLKLDNFFVSFMCGVIGIIIALMLESKGWIK